MTDTTTRDVYNSHVRVFISHSWKRDKRDRYYEMCLFLNQHLPNWRDRSVPKAGRYEDLDDNALNQEIAKLIKDSDVFIVFTYPIIYHSDWLSAELEMAKSAGLPIIAVQPSDNDRPADIVTKSASAICPWDGLEIAAAIHRIVKGTG